MDKMVMSKELSESVLSSIFTEASLKLRELNTAWNWYIKEKPGEWFVAGSKYF